MPLLRIEKKARVARPRDANSSTSHGDGKVTVRIGIPARDISVRIDDADFQVARHGGCQYVLSSPWTDVLLHETQDAIMAPVPSGGAVGWGRVSPDARLRAGICLRADRVHQNDAP